MVSRGECKATENTLNGPYDFFFSKFLQANSLAEPYLVRSAVPRTADFIADISGVASQNFHCV